MVLDGVLVVGRGRYIPLLFLVGSTNQIRSVKEFIFLLLVLKSLEINVLF